jgi:hypothetical protein
MLELSNITLVALATDKYYVPTINVFDFLHNKIIFKNKIILSNLNFYSSYTHIEIPSIINTIQYSGIVLYELYDLLTPFVKDDEYIMFVQYDGFPVNLHHWTDDFLNYDYIGAPWYFHDRYITSVSKNKFPPKVGNGGFSLRSMKLMKLCKTLQSSIMITYKYGNTNGLETNKNSIYKEYLKCSRWDGQVLHHAEDTIISVFNRTFLINKGIKFAPIELADKFSTETSSIDALIDYSKSFGIHCKYPNENINQDVIQILLENNNLING